MSVAALDAGGPDGLSSGSVLADRYRVESRLSSGALSAVYRATDQQAARPNAVVAVKVFDALRAADDISRARFEREFQALRRIHHPGVARVLDFVPGEEIDLLVLEFIEGETLKARLDRGRLEVEEAVGLVHRMLDALQVSHRSGVIHRDLKPSNVLLHPTRGPVIVDFGAAWFSSALTLTRTGAMIGSPRYMAPELLQQGRSDARADLYGVGALLFEMLAGRPARGDESLAELAIDPRRLWPKSLLDFRHVPRGLDAVLQRALSPRPEDRPATAAEMQTALTEGVRALGPAPDTQLSCSACGTPLIVPLPICPGCGTATDWVLRPGAYAVQILRVDPVAPVVAWLKHRHSAALDFPHAWLASRLAHPPVPLIVGVDRTTAEALCTQARAVGCEAEVVRAARLESLALRTPAARPVEIFSAAGLHLTGVLVIGGILIGLGAPAWAWAATPAVFGGVGAWLAARYAKRPLLSVFKALGARRAHPSTDGIAARLQQLRSDQARRLAAAAVGRAAPLLMNDDEGLSACRREEALAALDLALDIASELDAHHSVLTAGTGDSAREHAEVGAARDLAVRRGLEACEQITDNVRLRSEPVTK